MFRLLALLQLTRAALAFTAIADAWTVLLLRPPGPERPESMGWTILRMLIVSVVSASLYGFGMCLNDLLDARHDRLFAPRRPIPSGRIAPRTAILIAFLLLLLALLGAAILSAISGANAISGALVSEWAPWPFLFAFSTAVLIVLYDIVCKYLGAIGILTLGAIRALHCLIGNPHTPLLFLSMILLTHVFCITLIAYRLENKRPRLRRVDVWLGCLGLLIGNGLAFWYMEGRGTFHEAVGPMLIGPAAAMVVFGIWMIWLFSRKDLTPRRKGERLMLMGLFWLFVYDASMLFSNSQWLAGVAVIALFVCAVITFFVLRTFGRALTQQRLQYRIDRAGSAAIPATAQTSIEDGR